jgi:hypothetical protein
LIDSVLRHATGKREDVVAGFVSSLLASVNGTHDLGNVFKQYLNTTSPFILGLGLYLIGH